MRRVLVRIGGKPLSVEIVSEEDEIERGLSGRESLAQGEGMLFVFPEGSDFHPLWMVGMHFPLDFIWIDEGKCVVDLTEDIPPYIGDEELAPCYFPDQEVPYVIEVNAGWVAANSIRVGDSVEFELE